jgi:enhancer of polycomb-like protein
LKKQEHHLRAALNANHTGIIAPTAVVIPTPDASRLFPDHEKYYKPGIFSQPKTLIKFSAPLEECNGVPYCLDEKDDVFLVQYRSKCEKGENGLSEQCFIDDDLFESIMYTFERLGAEKVNHMFFFISFLVHSSCFFFINHFI